MSKQKDVGPAKSPRDLKGDWFVVGPPRTRFPRPPCEQRGQDPAGVQAQAPRSPPHLKQPATHVVVIKPPPKIKVSGLPKLTGKEYTTRYTG